MKNGIDYFPFVCQPDDKLELIEAEFGLKGLAIIVKLLQRIYGERGYYCEWNGEVALLFSRKHCGLGEGDNAVSEVVNTALKRGFFDKGKYEQFGVLTSAGIQKRYFEAVKRRISVEVQKEYLLVKVAQVPKNVDIIEKNVCRNGENVCRNQQSKVKESKVKESKVNNNNYNIPETGIFEKSFGYPPSDVEKTMLLSLLSNHDKEIVEYAFFQASQNNRKTLGYVKGVLNNLDKAGVRGMGDLAVYHMKRGEL